MCLLAHILPGYLNVPKEGDTSLDAYMKRSGKNPDATVTPQGLAGDASSNWWGNGRKYVVSLLKAWWGDAATAGNDFGFHWLPKCDPLDFPLPITRSNRVKPSSKSILVSFSMTSSCIATL